MVPKIRKFFKFVRNFSNIFILKTVMQSLLHKNRIVITDIKTGFAKMQADAALIFDIAYTFQNRLAGNIKSSTF